MLLRVSMGMLLNLCDAHKLQVCFFSSGKSHIVNIAPKPFTNQKTCAIPVNISTVLDFDV